MNKKVCLITGATRGLGNALSTRLKLDGYTVVRLGRIKQNDAALSLLDHYIECDLASNDAIDECVMNFDRTFGRLDLLVHNAAVQTHYSITQSHQYPALLSREMQVNFLAPIRLTSSFLPLLMQNQSRVVAISSLLQLGAKTSAPGYCASKAALSNWIGNLRGQLKNTHVSVTEVIPGLIKTNMTAAAQSKGIEPSILADYITRNLNQKRIILPGARFAWAMSNIAPWFVRNKLAASMD